MQPLKVTLSIEMCATQNKHHLRIDFHVVSEADVVDDVASELRPVKGRKGTKSSIHCYILGGQHVLVLCCHLIGNLHSHALLVFAFLVLSHSH